MENSVSFSEYCTYVIELPVSEHGRPEVWITVTGTSHLYPRGSRTHLYTGGAWSVAQGLVTLLQHHRSDVTGTFVVVVASPKVHPDSPPPMPGEDLHVERSRDRVHKVQDSVTIYQLFVSERTQIIVKRYHSSSYQMLEARKGP